MREGRGRVLAVDPGERRIGLAISDAGRTVALPFEVIEAREKPVQRIEEIAKEEGVEEIIVGLPLRMDGTEGPAAEAARRLASDLEASLGLLVKLVDERLTTKSAIRALHETGVSEKKGRRVVDKMAATLLLQSYLDGR